MGGSSTQRRLEEGPVPADPGNGPACPVAEDANITDGLIADLALANMHKLVQAGNPFALAGRQVSRAQPRTTCGAAGC